MKKRIAELREAMGFANDQAGFAERLGVTQATISNWEAGTFKPSRPRLEALERRGINSNWLRTGEGEMFLDKSAVQSDDIAEIIALYRKLTPEQRAILNTVAMQFLK